MLGNIPLEALSYRRANIELYTAPTLKVGWRLVPELIRMNRDLVPGFVMRGVECDRLHTPPEVRHASSSHCESDAEVRDGTRAVARMPLVVCSH